MLSLWAAHPAVRAEVCGPLELRQLSACFDRAGEPLPGAWFEDFVARHSPDPVDLTGALFIVVGGMLLSQQGRGTELFHAHLRAFPGLRGAFAAPGSLGADRDDVLLLAMLCATAVWSFQTVADPEAALATYAATELPGFDLRAAPAPVIDAYISLQANRAFVLARLSRNEEAAGLLTAVVAAAEGCPRPPPAAVKALAGLSVLVPPVLSRPLLARAEALRARLRMAASRAEDGDGEALQTLAAAHARLGDRASLLAARDLYSSLVPVLPSAHWQLAGVLEQLGEASAAQASQTAYGDARARSSLVCAGPDCARLCRADGGPLDFCASCRVTHYCSPKCQKADWKARHKAQCGQLRTEREAREAAGTTAASGASSSAPEAVASPLHAAIRAGRRDEILCLATAPGADLAVRDAAGRTPLEAFKAWWRATGTAFAAQPGSGWDTEAAGAVKAALQPR